MADYREIFDKLREQARDLAENSGVKDIYDKGATRAKNFGSATKLTVELNRDHTELEKIYTEIGKLCEQFGLLNSDFGAANAVYFSPLFDQLKQQRELIMEKEKILESLKASFGAPASSGAADPTVENKKALDDSILDFESIVNQTENDGKH